MQFRLDRHAITLLLGSSARLQLMGNRRAFPVFRCGSVARDLAGFHGGLGIKEWQYDTAARVRAMDLII